jgi:hypothetical protein
MQKQISMLMAAMFAAVTFNAIAADNKGSTNAAKAKAPPKTAVEAPKATPRAAARPGAEHGNASDASAGKGSAKSAGKY